jgi:hypothetical protein
MSYFLRRSLLKRCVKRLCEGEGGWGVEAAGREGSGASCISEEIAQVEENSSSTCSLMTVIS